MAVSECPSCTFHIALEPGLEVGNAIKCPDCGARLKLARAFPPVFEIADFGEAEDISGAKRHWDKEE